MTVLDANGQVRLGLPTGRMKEGVNTLLFGFWNSSQDE